MKTATITRTVVRTADSALDVTVEMPEGSTDEQIREALLDKATNMVFSTEHHSDYRLLDEVGQEDGAKAESDVRWILDELVRLGFHTDEEIDGAEAVEVLKTIFEDLTGSHRASLYSPTFIYSESEMGFWSRENGWVEIEDATPCYGRLESTPFGSSCDSRLVTREQAELISKNREVARDEPKGEPA